jgi:hypothetical protein
MLLLLYDIRDETSVNYGWQECWCWTWSQLCPLNHSDLSAWSTEHLQLSCYQKQHKKDNPVDTMGQRVAFGEAAPDRMGRVNRTPPVGNETAWTSAFEWGCWPRHRRAGSQWHWGRCQYVLINQFLGLTAGTSLPHNSIYPHLYCWVDYR